MNSDLCKRESRERDDSGRGNFQARFTHALSENIQHNFQLHGQRTLLCLGLATLIQIPASLLITSNTVPFIPSFLVLLTPKQSACNCQVFKR